MANLKDLFKAGMVLTEENLSQLIDVVESNNTTTGMGIKMLDISAYWTSIMLTGAHENLMFTVMGFTPEKYDINVEETPTGEKLTYIGFAGSELLAIFDQAGTWEHGQAINFMIEDMDTEEILHFSIPLYGWRQGATDPANLPIPGQPFYGLGEGLAKDEYGDLCLDSQNYPFKRGTGGLFIKNVQISEEGLNVNASLAADESYTTQDFFDKMVFKAINYPNDIIFSPENNNISVIVGERQRVATLDLSVQISDFPDVFLQGLDIIEVIYKETGETVARASIQQFYEDPELNGWYSIADKPFEEVDNKSALTITNNKLGLDTSKLPSGDSGLSLPQMFIMCGIANKTQESFTSGQPKYYGIIMGAMLGDESMTEDKLKSDFSYFYVDPKKEGASATIELDPANPPEQPYQLTFAPMGTNTWGVSVILGTLPESWKDSLQLGFIVIKERQTGKIHQVLSTTDNYLMPELFLWDSLNGKPFDTVDSDTLNITDGKLSVKPPQRKPFNQLKFKFNGADSRAVMNEINDPSKGVWGMEYDFGLRWGMMDDKPFKTIDTTIFDVDASGKLSLKGSSGGGDSFSNVYIDDSNSYVNLEWYKEEVDGANRLTLVAYDKLDGMNLLTWNNIDSNFLESSSSDRLNIRPAVINDVFGQISNTSLPYTGGTAMSLFKTGLANQEIIAPNDLINLTNNAEGTKIRVNNGIGGLTALSPHVEIEFLCDIENNTIPEGETGEIKFAYDDTTKTPVFSKQITSKTEHVHLKKIVPSMANNNITGTINSATGGCTIKNMVIIIKTLTQFTTD